MVFKRKKNKQKEDFGFPKPKLDKHSIPVILWNLLPLMGVLFANWKPESVFICYVLETVVVGIFNVIRMLVIHYYGLPPNKVTDTSDLVAIISFMIIYFAGAFLVLKIFFSSDDDGLFHALYVLLGQRSFNIALGAFILNNIYSIINDFILTGEYTRRTMGQQAYEPFPRLFVQQVVVMIGGGFFFLTGNGYPVLIVFVGVKIYLDLLLRNLPIGGFTQTKIK